MSTSGARYLHRHRNRVARELTPHGREVLKEAKSAMRNKGWSLTQAIDYVKRHRVGAYVEF